MMLLRLFITVSTSRIVEALKQKSKRKRFGLCLLGCCCRLVYNKLAAAAKPALARPVCINSVLFDLKGGSTFLFSHVQFVITYAVE